MSVRQRTIEDLKLSHLEVISSIPLYQQIRIDLQSMMQANKLIPGDLLPSEIELAQAYQVSRQTIRQAISHLVNDHLLERKRGYGTTVLAGRNRIKFFLNQSFAQQMLEMGIKPTSEVLRKNVTVIDENSPNIFHVKTGSRALDLIRLRYGNQVPIGVQYTTVLTDSCPDLFMHDFQNVSLYQLLLTHYRLPISRIDNVVNAVVADPWHQNLLLVNKDSPLLLVKTIAFLENNEPIEASTGYYRADKFEFSTRHDF